MAIRFPNPATLKNLSPKSRQSLLVAFFTLLLLRSRIANIPHEVVSKLKNVGSRPDVTQEELAQALQQVYVDEADGSKTLLVPHKGHISKVRSLPFFRPTNTQHIDFIRRST